MRMMKAARGMLVAVATLGAAVAFGPFGASAQEPKVLTMAFDAGAGLDNLDPRTLLTEDHGEVQLGFLDPLVRSYGSEVEPGAAESWEISADGMTYTFHLRDAKWSDGVRRDGRRLRLRLRAHVPVGAGERDLRRHPERRRVARRHGEARGARRQGARSEDRRLHAAARRPTSSASSRRIRRAGSRRHGGEVRRRLRRLGREPATNGPFILTSGRTRTRSS